MQDSPYKAAEGIMRARASRYTVTAHAFLLEFEIRSVIKQAVLFVGRFHDELVSAGRMVLDDSRGSRGALSWGDIRDTD